MREENDRIEKLLREPLSRAGLHLEEVKAVVAGTRRNLTVVIDLPETTTDPVSLDTIARATEVVDEALETEELFRDRPYNLEVTSPGATRKLTTPRHFRRVLGRELKVRVAGRPVHLVLTEVDEEGISGTDPKTGAPLHFAHSEVEEARVELKFG